MSVRAKTTNFTIVARSYTWKDLVEPWPEMGQQPNAPCVFDGFAVVSGTISTEVDAVLDRAALDGSTQCA